MGTTAPVPNEETETQCLTEGAWAAEGLTSESESDELELEELEESLELSEAMPVDSWRSTASASTASSGCSCFKILKGKRYCSQGCDSWWQPPLTMTQTQSRGLHCYSTWPCLVLWLDWLQATATQAATFAEGKQPSRATHLREHQPRTSGGGVLEGGSLRSPERNRSFPTFSLNLFWLFSLLKPFLPKAWC